MEFVRDVLAGAFSDALANMLMIFFAPLTAIFSGRAWSNAKKARRTIEQNFIAMMSSVNASMAFRTFVNGVAAVLLRTPKRYLDREDDLVDAYLHALRANVNVQEVIAASADSMQQWEQFETELMRLRKVSRKWSKADKVVNERQAFQRAAAAIHELISPNANDEDKQRLKEILTVQDSRITFVGRELVLRDE